MTPPWPERNPCYIYPGEQVRELPLSMWEEVRDLVGSDDAASYRADKCQERKEARELIDSLRTLHKEIRPIADFISWDCDAVSVGQGDDFSYQVYASLRNDQIYSGVLAAIDGSCT